MSYLLTKGVEAVYAGLYPAGVGSRPQSRVHADAERRDTVAEIDV